MLNKFTKSAALKPFPEAKDVFAPDQIDLAKHLHPLISIDLGAIRPEWSGWAHILSPLEPCDGYIGGTTSAFHSSLLQTNWIGFYIENDRYRLAGDRRYFVRETPNVNASDKKRLELEAYCAVEDEAYQASRTYFQKHGKLVRLDEVGQPSYGNTRAVELVEILGGEDSAYGGNWTGCTSFPIEDGPRRSGQFWPLSPDGRRFEFVAAVPGWHYRTSGADNILLFYEPVEKLAMLTFDWS